MRSAVPRALVVGALALAVTAMAQVPSDVVSIVSGGSWTTDKGRGSFRVIVKNGAGPKWTSNLSVEWLAEPDAAHQERRVIRSVQLVRPGAFYSVELPSIARIENGILVTLQGVDPDFPRHKTNCLFRLRADGHVDTLRECKHGT